MLAPGIHPGDVVDHLEFLANGLYILIQLRVAIAVGADADQEAKHEAEVVPDTRPLGTGRKLVLDVAYLAAHLVLDVHLYDGQSGSRHGVHVFQLDHFLQRVLDKVYHLQFDLLRGGTGVDYRDRGCLHGELGILQLAETEVGADTAENQQESGEVADRPFFQGQSGQIHGVSPRSG